MEESHAKKTNAGARVPSVSPQFPKTLLASRNVDSITNSHKQDETPAS
jgi:hypothetical protein